MKNIFITGIESHLGAAVLDDFLQNDYQVFVLESDRLSNSRIQGQPSNLHIVNEHIDSLIVMDDFFAGVDCIIHANGLDIFKPLAESELSDHKEITSELLNAALAFNVKRFIYLSTAFAFKPGSQNNTITEKSHQQDKKHSEILHSMALKEREVWRAVAEGLDAVILNPAVCLDSRSQCGFFDWLKSDLYTSHSINSAVNNAFIDVRDVATVCRLCLELDIVNEQFLLAAFHCDVKDFIADYHEKMRIHSAISRLKFWSMHLKKHFSTAWKNHFKLLQALFGRDYNFDCSKAEEVFNMSFRTKKEILDELDI